MEERRRKRRFTLSLPCMVCVSDRHDHGRCLVMTTTNVGLGGAFLQTDESLSEGESVSIGLMIARGDLWKNPDFITCVSLSGIITRIASEGIGVGFRDTYQIRRVPLLCQAGLSETIGDTGEVIGLAEAFRRRIGRSSRRSSLTLFLVPFIHSTVSTA